MANTVNESAIKKLKVLFTVVDRNKGEFYMDVISQFEVNWQMQLQGNKVRVEYKDGKIIIENPDHQEE